MLDRRFPRTAATFRLLYDSAQAWIDDRALRLGAGVAYYALFALVPLMFLATAIASFFLGAAVKTDLEEGLSQVVGDALAAALIAAIDTIDIGGSNTLSSLVGFGVVVFTSTLLFVAWKEVVDLLWDIPRERGARASIMRRLFGLAAVLGSGALLTINLAIKTLIAAIDQFVDNQLIDTLIRVAGSFLPVVLGALFVGILFKYTPDEDIRWGHVWFASVVTMALVALGSWAYGIYLDYVSLTSVASVAGAIFLGLVLVYYGTAIGLYGMEIVKHSHRGTGFVPLSFMSWSRPGSEAVVDG